jgi:beta-galactosidase
MPNTVPVEFQWGVATAAYQIEGGAAEDGKGPSIWDVFCQIPGKVARGESGAVACDHYHRWRDDIALMKQLDVRAYRLSVSWPRIQPQGRGAVNGAGLDFYDHLVDALATAGITPMITLFHWDLPAALQFELGGWAHPDLPRIFADYAEAVFARLGDRVKRWITINEPWVVACDGYLRGTHAPGVRNETLAYQVGHNLLRAHAYAAAGYRAARGADGAISVAINTSYAFPATEAAEDRAAAERAVESFGGWFADPLYTADYPAMMRARLGPLLPPFSPEDARLLARSTDYFALNYYASDLVRHAPDAGPMQFECLPQPRRAHTTMGWPVVPEGLHGLLHWIARRYPGLPVFVSENGCSWDERLDADGTLHDERRIAYLRDHIAALQRAQAEGVPVGGYYVWSLLDNFEWAHGYDRTFGLVQVDRETLVRTPKASAHWYADFTRAARR